MRTIQLFLLMLLWISTAQAEIFKWYDDDGKLHFGDRPPQEAETEQVEVKINTFSSPEIVDTAESSDATKVASAGKVVMYSAEWCGVCKRARSYFRNNGISFTEYDVEKSNRGKRDYKRLGGTGVPIILIGERRINGFTPAAFQSIYGP